MICLTSLFLSTLGGKGAAGWCARNSGPEGSGGCGGCARNSDTHGASQVEAQGGVRAGSVGDRPFRARRAARRPNGFFSQMRAPTQLNQPGGGGGEGVGGRGTAGERLEQAFPLPSDSPRALQAKLLERVKPLCLAKYFAPQSQLARQMRFAVQRGFAETSVPLRGKATLRGRWRLPLCLREGKAGKCLWRKGLAATCRKGPVSLAGGALWGRVTRACETWTCGFVARRNKACMQGPACET